MPKPVFTRKMLNQPLTLTFEVEHPGELASGMRGYSEKVTVTVDSGDPGGEAGEFALHIRQALEDWHHGARVTWVS